MITLKIKKNKKTKKQKTKNNFHFKEQSTLKASILFWAGFVHQLP